MATKTSSKTATRKPAPKAFGAGRKTTAPQKPADVASKAKKGLKTDVAPAAAPPPARHTTQPEKPGVSGQAAPPPESVSLIDRKKPAKKSQDGEIKSKRTVLPPISRIRESLGGTSVSPKPPPAPVEQAPPPQAPFSEPAEKPPAEVASVTAEVEAAPKQKVHLIKPPIVVKQFANE